MRTQRKGEMSHEERQRQRLKGKTKKRKIGCPERLCKFGKEWYLASMGDLQSGCNHKMKFYIVCGDPQCASMVHVIQL